MDELERIEHEREQRKIEAARLRREQRAKDLARVNELEIELGDDSVAVVAVGRYIVGLPTLVAVRAMSATELKRYRDRTRQRKSDEPVDYTPATDEAAETCVLYPDRSSDDWRALVAAVPALPTKAGVAAVKLTGGVAEAEGNG